MAALSLFALAACGGGGEEQPPQQRDATVTAMAATSGADGGTPAALAALTVTSSVPGDGGNNTPRNRQPSFTFSSLLNAASVNSSNFALRAGPVTVPSAIRVIDRVARLEPEAKLLPQTLFTVRAEPGILDTFGQTLAAPVQRNFTTADAAWKETMPLPGVQGLTGPLPAVALDPRGNAWVAWYTSAVAAQNVLYVNRFDAATGSWGAPVAIGGGSNQEMSQPQIATDAAGNAVLVWAQRPAGGYFSLRASRYSATAGSWETPRVISNDPDIPRNHHHNAMPRLAVRANGDITVAWRRAGFGVYVSAASAGSGLGWLAPIRIDDPDTGEDNAVASLSISVSPAPGGRAAIAWATGNAFERSEVWAIEFAGMVPWPFARPRRLSDPDGGPDLDASVSADSAGQVYVVWRHVEETPSEYSHTLRYAHFDGTDWSASRQFGGAQALAFGAAIASHTELGQAATWVTWFDTSGSRRVMAARLRPGGADTPQVIGLPPASSLDANQRTSLAVDRAGNVVVTWTTGTTSADGRVMAARYVARLGAWQAVRTLDQRPLGFPFTASLASNASGDVVALWNGFVNDPVNPARPIFTRRFD